MGKPAARVGDLDAAGNPITGPGVATVLIVGQPASVMGDTVNGPTCIGAIIIGSPTVLIQGRPAARMGDSITGSNPAALGVPISTTVMSPCAPTVLIGP